VATDKGSIWRNRDFTLLLGGTTVNSIGDWLLELALPVYVFLETDSGVLTAAVYVVRLLIGVLFGPLGGSLADRWRLRPTLVATNLLQIAALAPLLAVDSDRIWPVFVVVVLQGSISGVNDPASFALLPRLVSGDRLVAANSAMSAGGSVARLIGAAAGGIAVSTGGMSAVAILDGATFAVGALAAALMSAATNRSAVQHDSAEETDTSIRAGVQIVRSRPTMAAVLWVQTLAMLGFGIFLVVFIVFVTEELGGDGTEVGVIRAVSAFGGILAAAMIGGLANKHHPANVMAGGFLLFTMVAFLFVNAPSVTTALWVYLVLFAMSGFPNVASQVGTTSTAQLLCPPEVLGRMGGLMSAATALGMGIGSASAGLLLEVTTARTVFNGQVAILLACGVISAWFVARPIRREQPPS